MVAPPKTLLGLGASILTLRAGRRLQRRGLAPAEQERARRFLVQRIAATAYGRRFGLAPNATYAEFQKQIPARPYEHFGPYLERIKHGERDVLWPGTCPRFAVTAGTTGRPKHIPVPNEMLVHFRRAGLESLLHYTARVQRSTVFRGRHLIVGGSTAVEAIGPSAVVADVSGIAIANLPAWVEKHFFEPGREISAMTEWEPKLAAIAARTRAKDIAVVAGLPTALLALAEVALRERGNGNGATARLSTLWPTLECLVHGGLSLGPFGDELRQLAGNGVSFHEVYPSAEGFIAAQDADASAGLRLMTDTGLFFEFVPLADFQESHLDTVSAKAVPLEGAKVGVDYALLLTAPSGLCRYITGDIVRLLNLDPPRLVYCGQTRLLLSAWGERVTERELTGALTLTCQRHQWRTVNFHVAPLPAGPGGGRHEWWLELKPGTVETPKGPAIAAELDDEIQRHNALYRAKRKGGQLQEPVVRLVMPGVFEQWARQRGRWGGHGKTPRSRPDRQIADELAKLSPFSP